MKQRRAARVADIAREAGVGTATVDRVLNGRSGVSAGTIDRVRRAEEVLTTRNFANGRLRSDQGGAFQFEVILPSDAGPSTDYLGQALRNAGETSGANVTCSQVEKMNPIALANRLNTCVGTGLSGVAFQALDHPMVRDAVARLTAERVPCLALMSDLDDSEVFGFVGADNRAAGRSAGYLMGRFVRKQGKVAVLWGGELYRSHEQREIGFRTVVRSEYPHLTILDLVSGGDTVDGNYQEVAAVLREHGDLVGIYSVGGGNRGVVQALQDHGRARDVVVIGHNLTSTTQRFLFEGSMDAIIHQNMDLAATRAIDALIGQCIGRAKPIERLPVEIVIRENIPKIRQV